MRKRFLGVIAGCCLMGSLQAQTDPADGYRNFPLVITLQFHCFSLPFRDMLTNFSNVGIGIGTEVSYNGKPTGVQQLTAVWYHNKRMGNGLLFYTQAVWRPSFGSSGFGELKTGVGYYYSFRPVASYKQLNGKWVSVGHKGKGMLTIPTGISLGSSSYSTDTYQAPFVSYQFLLVKDYNKDIPLVPETLIQVGSRIHFKE